MKRTKSLLIIAALFLISILYNSHPVDAFSWDGNDIAISEYEFTRPDWTASYMKGCSYEKINVFETELTEVPCVIRGNHYSFAKINYYGCGQQCFAFTLKDGDIFYRVDLRKDQNPVFFKGTDQIGFYSTMFLNTYFYGPVFYNDVSKLLSFEPTSQTYSVNISQENPDYSLKNQNGTPSSALYVGSSGSGEYILYGDAFGLYLLRTQNGVLKVISRDNFSRGDVNGTVSSDGKVAVVGGKTYMQTKVYNLTECGTQIEYANITLSEESYCSFDDLTAKINYQYGDAWYNNFEIVNDNKTITFTYDKEDGYQTRARQIAVGIPLVNRGVDYLALGDSYSSGEGDIGKKDDGQSYYLSGTESDGGCHISSRSYPFLLANFSGTPNDKMRSVACSGARVAKDYFGQQKNYFGQRGQLRALSLAEQEDTRALALKDFTPGILKQIDFVRKNKPKAITLTGGGNDVGFSSIIKNCVYTVGIGNKTGTCDEAVPGTPKRAIIGDAIQTQFTEIKKLIAALKEASQTTTIYLIGYPTFLADGPSSCVNSVALTQQEREGINSGVRYLNDLLAAAAKSTGAKYVDIETSLASGRICEGSEYMTGVLDMIGGAQPVQTFHPNHKGHVQMAQAIIGTGFEVAAENNPAPIATDLPKRPATFNTEAFVPTFQEKMLIDARMIARKANPISIAADTYVNIRDNVRFTLRSKAVDLGSFTVGSDGSLVAKLTLPKNTDLGAHMLVADITSQDGSKKRLYQYIEVRSDDANDDDGDNIPNQLDNCLYVMSWIDEETGIDICKRPKANGFLPGKGIGHGYGHLYSNGLHSGHIHEDSLLFKW